MNLCVECKHMRFIKGGGSIAYLCLHPKVIEAGKNVNPVDGRFSVSRYHVEARACRNRNEPCGQEGLYFEQAFEPKPVKITKHLLGFKWVKHHR